MNEMARQKLAELVGRFGRDVVNDARRCEALLRDVCPQHKREVFVLVSAVRECVPGEMLTGSAAVPKPVLLSRLSRRLHDNLGLDEALTRWAVESWAFALGLISAAECGSPASTPFAGSASSDDDIFSDFPRTSTEEMFRQTIRRVLADGVVTDEERAEVQELCRKLGVPRDVASRILNEVKAEMGIDQPESRSASSPSTSKPARSSSTAAIQYRAVDLTEVLLEPASFSGEAVRIEGVYASLYTGDESFKLEQGDHEIWVFYSKVSRDQKSIILRESEAEGRHVVVEGVLKTGHGDLKLRAANVLIDGMQAKAPARSADGSIQLAEILLDPASFGGQQVRLRGKYASLYTGDESFKVEQGDHEIWVFYSQLPRDQKALVLREGEAEGRTIVIDGELKARRGDMKLVASNIAFEATVYAAIAYSQSTGNVAYSYCCDSPEAAQRAAVEHCEGVDAQAVVWVRDGFCALALAANGARGWGWGDTADAAARAAWEGCSEHSGGNEIFVQVVSARDGHVQDDEAADDSDGTPSQADQTTVTNSTAESVLAAPAPAPIAPTQSSASAASAEWITEQLLTEIVWSVVCPHIEDLKARFATRTTASPKQIENIRSACHIPFGEPILALIDVTIRGNGMNGICFTPKGMYWYYKFMGFEAGRGGMGYDQFAQETFDPKGSDEILTRSGAITMSTLAQARDPTIVFLRTLRDRIATATTASRSTDQRPASAPPAATSWYYVKQGQRQGPLTTDALKALAATGQLQRSDLVWRDGMSEWAQGGSVAELFPQTAPTASPSPAPSASGSERVRQKCPTCGCKLKLGASAAGRRLPCPGCKALLEVSADLQLVTRAEEVVQPTLMFCPTCNGVLLPPEGGAPQQCVHCGWSSRPTQEPSQRAAGDKSAAVRHKCPACGKGLKMGANVAGQRLPCPACKAVLHISADLQQVVLESPEFSDLDDIVLIDPTE